MIASAGFLIVEQSVYVPETESHLLMIESTRYLVNQLPFERTGDEAYKNRTNGLTDWLLSHLQTFAKHDFLEFNSRPYSRLTMHAIMNFYEFDRDRALAAVGIPPEVYADPPAWTSWLTKE